MFVLHIYTGASYFVGRFLVSFFWGVVADRVGRKPIIIFSVASVWVQLILNGSLIMAAAFLI